MISTITKCDICFDTRAGSERVAAAPLFYDEVRFFRIFLVFFGIVIF